jgi:peroxiredoxin (alkyl hydroperoxide reductase subunit C)
VRAVFIVDAEGFIRIMLYYPQELGRNMDEILRAVEAMQVSDKHKVSMPAQWPKGELFGDHVIVPPPKNVEDVKKRIEGAKSGDYECLDWWLCHKKI